jgi:hypothetical protein
MKNCKIIKDEDTFETVRSSTLVAVRAVVRRNFISQCPLSLRTAQVGLEDGDQIDVLLAQAGC